MQRFNQTEKLAFQIKHPKRKAVSYSVWYGKQCLSGAHPYALCVHLKNNFANDLRFKKHPLTIEPNY